MVCTFTTILAVIWLVVSLLSGFIMGAAVLGLLYRSDFAALLRTITLYDFLQGFGYWFSVLMSLVATFTWTGNVESHHNPRWNALTVPATVAGVVILAALLFGKFVLPLVGT